MNRKELNSFKQSVYRSLNEEIGGGQPKPPQPFPIPSGPTPSPQPFPNPSGPTPSPKPLPHPRPYGYRYQNTPSIDPVVDQELRDAGEDSQIPLPLSPPQTYDGRPQILPKYPFRPGYYHYDILTPWWNNPGWEVPYPIRPNTRPLKPSDIRFA